MSETRPASLMPLISSAETRKHEREQQHELLHTVKIASSEEEIKSGEGFYIAPRLMPEAYPGDKPETTGFLVDAKDGLVTGILWNSDSSLFVNQGDFNPVVERSDPESPDGKSQVPLDEYLTGKGLTPLSERYVLTAFGSNRCPGQLQHKFQKWIKDNEISDESIANDLLTVPAFNGILKGYDVVYNSTLGNLGYAFGDLYAGPETQDTEIEVVNLFLTKEQMQVIHESEVEYQFAEIGSALKHR